jgi:hypothetical protein
MLEVICQRLRGNARSAEYRFAAEDRRVTDYDA